MRRSQARPIRMIPPHVLAECREKAHTVLAEGKPINRVAALVVVIVWIPLAMLAVFLVAHW